MSLPTYCSECDAPEGHCGHTGPRYLDPPEYAPIYNPKGKRVGYNLAGDETAEHERWGNPPIKPATPTPTDQPKPINQILLELEGRAVIDLKLRTALTEAHAENLRALTRLTDKYIAEHKAGGFTNPEGMLWHRLKNLAP
jgi:hypothetical protein